MRLLLAWLLGVPLLVGCMVLARASLLPEATTREPAPTELTATSGCLGQAHHHHVAPAVIRQRHRDACEGRPVH